MPFSPPTAANVLLVRFIPNGELPTEELRRVIQRLLTQGTLSRVAIMVDSEEVIEALRMFDLQWLDPEEDYQWSGWKVRRKIRRPPKRVIAGSYTDWFRWFMSSQRFRAFNAVILVNPIDAVIGKRGGYIDGMLARIMAKGRQFVVVSKPLDVVVSSDEQRTRQVLRSLLYGTRLSMRELLGQSLLSFVPVPEEMVTKSPKEMNLHLTKSQTRYQLDSYNAGLLERAYPEAKFEQKKRFKAEALIPDATLAHQVIRDVENASWVTVPSEAENLHAWLQRLNEHGDRMLRDIHESMEDTSDEQWEALLAPTAPAVRRVLDELVTDGKLQRTTLYKEVGRPALAYSIPGKVPFLERRCGQCAFYAPVKRRCNLWWLANKRQPFFDNRWKQSGTVTEFEIHKMRYSSKIGPHSSGCLRFVDKKRDHMRNSVPERCEVCAELVPRLTAKVATCQNCKTRYIRLGGRVRVMTAYDHEYNRLYREITGGEVKADISAWRHKVREDLKDRQKMLGLVDEFDDILAEEPAHFERYAPRVWPTFSPRLQASVDELTKTTNIARQLSTAIVQSAFGSTRRILRFGGVYSGDADPLIARQEKYIMLLAEADASKLLPYEALVMKQYWLAFGFALRSVQQWFGPRKKSRFVTEYVEGWGGRAKGYSPLDAAVNYLHQRRLRQAERINSEVGFPGSCDGFLHKERYNSRNIGLLLDMIDSFKFADREQLLLFVLNRGLTWKDFSIETDRRGSNFYYPRPSTVSRLDQVGTDTDSLSVKYMNREMSLSEAYRKFAENLLDTLSGQKAETLMPFILVTETDS